MLRVGYFEGQEGKITSDIEIVAMNLLFVEKGMTFIGKLLTKEELMPSVDFKVDAYRDLAMWVYYHYKLPRVSQGQLTAIAKDYFKLVLTTVSQEVLEWLSNKVFEKIQYNKALFYLKSDEYLNTNEFININTFMLSMLGELFVYSTVLPVLHDEFDLRSITQIVKAYGVDELIRLMKKRYGEVETKGVGEEVTRVSPATVEQIIREISETPKSLSELSSEYGIPVPVLKVMLLRHGAVYDELSGKWFIPNEERAKIAYNVLYEYALSEKTSIISINDAIRILTESGFTEDEASAYIAYLNNKGMIIIRNGLIEIPAVKKALVVKEEAPKSKKFESHSKKTRMTESEKEKVYEEVREIAEEYASGEISVEEAVDVIVKGAETLNKTTFLKMYRIFTNTVREENREAYDMLMSVLKSEFGTVSGSKLYDIINKKFKKGESIYPTESEKTPPEKEIREAYESARKEEVKAEEEAEKVAMETEAETRKAEKEAEEEVKEEEGGVENPVEELIDLVLGKFGEGE